MSIQEVGQLKEEKAHLEKQTADLQAKCHGLEDEKFKAIMRARNSMQLLEEANLQKNQVRKQVSFLYLMNAASLAPSEREELRVQRSRYSEVQTAPALFSA